MTPARAQGIPTNSMGAGRLPTVTVTGKLGAGNSEIGVPKGSAAPVAMGGDTAPAPVMNSVIMAPGAALVLGTGAPLRFTKMPGADAATGKVAEVLCPLLLMVRVAVLFGAIP